MLRMTGGWTSLDAGRKFSDTNCGFPQRSQPQSPPVLENFDHIVGPQFSRKISEIWANFLVAFVFSQNCANFHAISISQKAENFLAVKNSRKLCKFPGHPILDFNLPGRRPICTSVIPPPPVFSAADNCELTERPHKCLDSDTTALKYIPPSTERYSSQDILTSINQPRQKSLMTDPKRACCLDFTR